MNQHDSGADQEIAALARLLPDLAGRDLPAGRHPILKEHLMSEIRQASGTDQASSRRPGNARHGRPRRRLAVLAAAATAAGALIAGAVIGLGPASPQPARHHHGAPGGASAAQLLATIAKAAARRPVPAVRDSQFAFISSEVAFTSTSVSAGPGGKQTVKTQLQPPHRRQIWYSASNLCRKGLVRENGRDTALNDGGRCPDRGSLNDPTYRLLQRLPTEPRALLRLIYRVERGHGPSRDAEAFTTIGDLLRESITPPAVSAALYRAAALIPGVTVISRATDAIGRHGVAVAFTSQDTRSEWIFARRTLQLIGERDVAVKSGATTGVSAILVRGFVDHVGQIPGGSARSSG